MHYLSRECTKNSLSVSVIYCEFVIFSRIYYLVHKRTIFVEPSQKSKNNLINIGFEVWTYVYWIQLVQIVRHDLILNNFEFQSPTKFWVETYVYLIYFDQPARFNSYWTSLTIVWPLMPLIDLEKYDIWIVEKILSRNIRILDTYN